MEKLSASTVGLVAVTMTSLAGLSTADVVQVHQALVARYNRVCKEMSFSNEMQFVMQERYAVPAGGRDENFERLAQESLWLEQELDVCERWLGIA